MRITQGLAKIIESFKYPCIKKVDLFRPKSPTRLQKYPNPIQNETQLIWQCMLSGPRNCRDMITPTAAGQRPDGKLPQTEVMIFLSNFPLLSTR